MPIREALANLEKKGLAESVPYAGTRLVTLTKDDVRQIYIARTALEPVAAKYACEKITDCLLYTSAKEHILEVYKPEAAAM